jgi:hypothetical protein
VKPGERLDMQQVAALMVEFRQMLADRPAGDPKLERLVEVGEMTLGAQGRLATSRRKLNEGIEQVRLELAVLEQMIEGLGL